MYSFIKPSIEIIRTGACSVSERSEPEFSQPFKPRIKKSAVSRYKNFFSSMVNFGLIVISVRYELMNQDSHRWVPVRDLTNEPSIHKGEYFGNPEFALPV